MSETIPRQQPEFDPVAEAQAHANYDQRANFQREWLGLGEGATPEQVAQAARDAEAYFSARPASADEAVRPDRHYDTTMGETDREKSMMDLVREQAQAEVNSDSTRAKDIQEEINRRILKTGAKRDEKYDEASMPALEREAHRLNTLFNKKEKIKAGLSAEAGAPGDDDDAPTDPPAPTPAPTETRETEEPTDPTDPTDDGNEGGDPTPKDPTEPEPRDLDETQEIESTPQPPAPDPHPNGRRSNDPRYPMRGFNTWTEQDLNRAHARARGEEVPAREGLLEHDYFDILQDLPRDPDAVELAHLIAEDNDYYRRGEAPRDGLHDEMQAIADQLAISHPGLRERLYDVYAVGGALQHPNAKMTLRDAEFIDLLHRYKGMERNQGIRSQIQEMYEQINAAEGDVPVNWRRNADGTITPQEGSRTQHKGDWLIARHQGARLGSEFNLLKRGLIAEGSNGEGEEHGPTGAAGRFWQRTGRVAVWPLVAPVRGVRNLIERRRRAAGADAPAPTRAYDRLDVGTFAGTDPEATRARRAAAQQEIDENRARSGFDPATMGQADPERADRPPTVRPARAPRTEDSLFPPRTPEATGPTRRQRAAARLGQLVRPGGLAPSGGPAEAPGVGNELPTQPMTEAEIAELEARLNAEADAEEARRRAS